MISCVQSSAPKKHGFLKQYQLYDSYAYYTSLNQAVVSSSNLTDWKTVVNVGPSGNDKIVSGFELMSPNVCLARRASSTSNDLYFSYYSYSIESNSAPFTAESAYYAYQDNIDALNGIYASSMSSHIQHHHLASDSDMALINSFMGRDF